MKAIRIAIITLILLGTFYFTNGQSPDKPQYFEIKTTGGYKTKPITKWDFAKNTDKIARARRESFSQ